MTRSHYPSELPPSAELEIVDQEPSITGEMCARGTILMAFREAAMELWGEAGLRELGQRLPEAARVETLEISTVNLAWVPEAYVLAWYDAVWHGPCEKRRDAFRKFLNCMMDHGFGRVRKAFLSLAQPPTILNRAPGLWRHDHTHGELTVESLESESARVRLSNHPYTATSLACLATAEIYRYCVTLCRAKNVTELHYREAGGSLVVRLRWQS